MKAHTKMRTNVSIDEELLREARSQKVVLSTLLEEAIRLQLKKNEHTRWLEENKEAIDAYNREVEQYGVFSDGLRSF